MSAQRETHTSGARERSASIRQATIVENLFRFVYWFSSVASASWAQSAEISSRRRRFATFSRVASAFSRIDFHLQESQLFFRLSTTWVKIAKQVWGVWTKETKKQFFDSSIVLLGYVISPHWCCLEIFQIHQERSKKKSKKTCSRRERDESAKFWFLTWVKNLMLCLCTLSELEWLKPAP